MNIAGVLEQQARRQPHRLAIVEAERSITFGDLDRAAGAAATELAAAGVTAGMRVLVFSRMSVGLYTTLIALFRLRATAVFIDPAVGRERLNRCVARVRPGAFAGMPRAHWLRLSSSTIRDIPIKVSIEGRVPGVATIGRTVVRASHPVEPCDPETPAIVTFTSGSTGEPKAAVRTHGFLLAQHRALVQALELEPGDVDLCTLPIFLLANLASGVTSVIPDADLRAVGAIDPGPVVTQIQATRSTRTVASPAFLARLANYARQSGSTLDTFRRIHTGGAPVFPATLDAIAGVAPHASIVAVYGSTEAEPIAEIDRAEITARDRAAMAEGAGLLAGRPVPSIDLRILPDRWGTPIGPFSADAFDHLALGSDRTGEILVSGEHVLEGYLDGVGDEETKVRAGGRVWHRTGDAGRLDPHGRLWLLGRCSARVSDEAGTLYPFAVEASASEVPAVVRSAFVVFRGRRALVVEQRGRPEEVRADLLARLSWAQLSNILVVSRIPVDARHNAKIEYPELLRMLDRLRE